MDFPTTTLSFDHGLPRSSGSARWSAPLRIALLVGLATLAVGCDDGPAGAATDAPPRVVLALAPAELAVPAPPTGSSAVRVAFYLTTPHGVEIARADAAPAIGSAVAGASRILGACELHLAVEGAGVVSVPSRLLTVDGNERGSWGGHPPDSVGDPDAFMYTENERLTAEARELFGSVRGGLPDNAIAAFVVRAFEYWIGEQMEPAAGLSFAPVIYHAEADYPSRNSVLLRSAQPLPGDVSRLFAHELGHMLLNTGAHRGEQDNLMRNGEALTAQQCAVMRENLARLYGAERVVDPGPPQEFGRADLSSGSRR